MTRLHQKLILIRRGFIVTLAALALLSGDPPDVFASQQGIQVEGIVTGLTADPEELSILINGRVFQKGDRFQDYEITKIQPQQADFKNLESGETFSLKVGEVLKDEKEPVEAAPDDSKPWFLEMMEKHFPNLAGLYHNVRYSSVVADLRKIHITAFQHYLTDRPKHVSLGDLVARGLLPSFMRSGIMNGYRYRVHLAKSGVRTVAEPVEDASSKLHFMMDEHSYVYAEEGRPATPESPRFKGGFSLQVMPDP